MKTWSRWVRLSVLVVLATTLVLTTACGGGGSKSTNPEEVALGFVTALLQGDMDGVKVYIAPDRTEKVESKLDEVGSILAQYDTEKIEVGSTRPTGFLGDTDAKRVEIRFAYRSKDAADEPLSIGMIGVVVSATGSLFQVSDLVLERPQE